MIGSFAFGEKLPMKYGIGVSIMVVGVYLVQHGTGPQSEPQASVDGTDAQPNKHSKDD